MTLLGKAHFLKLSVLNNIIFHESFCFPRFYFRVIKQPEHSEKFHPLT